MAVAPCQMPVSPVSLFGDVQPVTQSKKEEKPHCCGSGGSGGMAKQKKKIEVFFINSDGARCYVHTVALSLDGCGMYRS